MIETSSLLCFHGVFDQPDYARLFIPFGLVENEGARLIYTQRNGRLISGSNSSMGGVAFSHEIVKSAHLADLLNLARSLSTQSFSKEPQAAAINLRLGPSPYYPDHFFAGLQAAFALDGWSDCGEITYVIDLRRWNPRNSVTRNHRKAQRGGVTSKKITPQQLHAFLSDIKQSKGYAFNYSADGLARQAEHYPTHFNFFGAFIGEELVAALMQYTFATTALLVVWDQSELGKALAATDFLLLECLQNLYVQGYEVVDMGTVTLNRQPNWGLIRHKENFGATAYIRPSLIKERV